MSTVSCFVYFKNRLPDKNRISAGGYPGMNHVHDTSTDILAAFIFPHLILQQGG